MTTTPKRSSNREKITAPPKANTDIRDITTQIMEKADGKTTISVNVRMPQDLKEQLNRFALKEGRTTSGAVKIILQRYFEEHSSDL